MTQRNIKTPKPIAHSLRLLNARDKEMVGPSSASGFVGPGSWIFRHLVPPVMVEQSTVGYDEEM